jgi:hypothetical protein
MKTDDERVEAVRRQFTPKRPRPLPGTTTGRSILWAGGTVAAALVLAFGALMVRRADPPGRVDGVQRAVQDVPPAATAAHMSHVREWNIEAADRMLTELSARVLPDVERRDGTLHVLARE